MLRAILPITAASAALTAVLFQLLGKAHPMPLIAATTEAVVVNHAFHNMLVLTVPIFAIVVSTLAYILIFFRAEKESDQGRKFDSSPGKLVEGVWIGFSLVLTLGLAAYGAEEYLAIRGTDDADITIQVKAAQWSWEFYYPEQDTFTSELYLPKGKRVRLLVTSQDVVHSFWVPEFRVKQDAVPGKVVKLLMTPVQLGEFMIVCAELCGLDHSVMTAPVKIVEPEALQGLLKGEDW